MKKIKVASVLLFSILICSFLCHGVFAVGELSPTVRQGALGYRLQVSVAQAGKGTVVVLVDGVEQMEATSLSVTEGANVTLIATASQACVFEKWESNADYGIDYLQSTVTFKMPKDNVVFTANFAEQILKYTVTIATNENGMSVPFAFKDFNPGDEVRVEAEPYEGYRFVRWVDTDGALANLESGWETQRILTFPMPKGSVSLNMEFEAITYEFSIKIQGVGEVEVDGKKKNSNGKYECTVGEEIFLSATPGFEYVFVNWSGNNRAEFSDYDKTETNLVCPPSDFTVTANFASGVRNLTLASTEGGKVTPKEGTVRVGVDNLHVVTAVPDVGYAFSHWECSVKDGKFENTKDAETTFTMPDEDCTVTAVFIKAGYLLNLSASAGGRVSGGGSTYEMGTKVKIKATPLKGYVFSHWDCKIADVVVDEKKAETEVVIPGDNVTVTAIFVLQTDAKIDTTKKTQEEGKSVFSLVALILIFILSAVAITLIVIRERYHLSYGYLIKKLFSKKTQ